MDTPSPFDQLRTIASEAGIGVAWLPGDGLPGGLALGADGGTPRRMILLSEDLDARRRAAVLAFCIAAFADQRTEKRLSRNRGRMLGVDVRPRRPQRRVGSLAQHMLRALGQDTPVAFTLVDVPEPAPGGQNRRNSAESMPRSAS